MAFKIPNDPSSIEVFGDIYELIWLYSWIRKIAVEVLAAYQNHINKTLFKAVGV